MPARSPPWLEANPTERDRSRFRVHPDDEAGQRDQTAGVRPRILIVDDHDGFRAVARAMLEDDGFDVVGEAVDGGSAVMATEALRPGIVLLDVHLPDSDGFSVSERLAALSPPPVVVLISSRPLGELRQRVTDSPVAGFIPKHELSGAALIALTA
ncbi:MAG: response regulator transcription factor [Sporichthyaceae bacterium]|nr:response regulator transcription factor [Sporichthyaceae bacterium]